MTKMLGNVQDKIKTSSSTAALFGFRAISGLFVGMTLSLIGEEIIGYGTVSSVLILLTMTGVVLRVSKNWNWLGLLIFNLICVLIGLVLRMYILIAPG